jgi:hypothetical protein
MLFRLIVIAEARSKSWLPGIPSCAGWWGSCRSEVERPHRIWSGALSSKELEMGVRWRILITFIEKHPPSAVLLQLSPRLGALE